MNKLCWHTKSFLESRKLSCLHVHRQYCNWKIQSCRINNHSDTEQQQQQQQQYYIRWSTSLNIKAELLSSCAAAYYTDVYCRRACVQFILLDNVFGLVYSVQNLCHCPLFSPLATDTPHWLVAYTCVLQAKFSFCITNWVNILSITFTSRYIYNICTMFRIAFSGVIDFPMTKLSLSYRFPRWVIRLSLYHVFMTDVTQYLLRSTLAQIIFCLSGCIYCVCAYVREIW